MSATLSSAPHLLALHNPALLDPDSVGLAHSLRRPLAERLLALLKRLGPSGAPQHQLILGGPGSGKTMLLRTLRHAILHDAELSRRWLPLTFPEAQWDVARPADLWVNALDYLVVALERGLPAGPAGGGGPDAAGGAGGPGAAAGAGGPDGHGFGAAAARRLEELVASLPDDEDARTKASLALLVSESERLGLRFVLLVDTLDVVLDRLKKDQWHVREVLSSEPRLMVIGTSARAIEATYRYDAAFYDFFQLHELRPLVRERLAPQLEALAEGRLRTRLLQLQRAAPSVFETCLDLLGSQPRKLALLANAVHELAGHVLDSGEPLPTNLSEMLVLSVLDALTPTMMAKMDALAPQSQMVVHAVATAWHPARPQEVAQRSRLHPNVVSAQLHRLVQEGVIEKVPLPPGGRHGVLLADRLFQVWLLLRLGQPHRRRLVTAARALEAARRGIAPDADTLAALSWPRELIEIIDPDVVLARIAPEIGFLATNQISLQISSE